MLDLERRRRNATDAAPGRHGRGRARPVRRIAVVAVLAAGALAAGALAAGALAIRFVSDAPVDTGRPADGSRRSGGAPATLAGPRQDGPADGPVRATAGDGTLTATLSPGRLSVELLVLPARVGANQVHVTVYAPDGTAEVSDLEAAFEPPHGGSAASNLAPERVAANHFLIPAARLPASGDWELLLTMRVKEVDDAGATIVPTRAVETTVVLPVA
jgi:hypothetical protein